MSHLKWFWAFGIVTVLAVSGLTIWGALLLVDGQGAADDTAASEPPSPSKPTPSLDIPADPLWPGDDARLPDGRFLVEDRSLEPAPEVKLILDRAAQAEPAGELDPTAIFTDYRFEPIVGFMSGGRGIAPARGFTAEERDPDNRFGNPINRHLPAEGWALWRVTGAYAHTRSRQPMLWFDDGSPGVLVMETRWFDEKVPGGGDAEGESCWIFLAPADAQPVAAYSFKSVREDLPEHATAVLREVTGRPLSARQMRECMASGLGQAGAGIVGDEQIASLLILVALNQAVPVHASVDEPDAMEQRWSVQPVDPDRDSHASDYWHESLFYATRALAAIGHPAMPTLIGGMVSTGPASTALEYLSDGAVERWHASERDPLVAHLRHLVVSQAKRYPNDPFYDPAAVALLMNLHRVDPGRAKGLAVSLLGHEDEPIGWAAVTALQKMVGGLAEVSNHRTVQLLVDADNFQDSIDNDGAMGEADSGGDAAAYRFLTRIWPRDPRLADPTRDDQIEAALGRISDPKLRCIQAFHLFLMTRPSVPLHIAIDLLQSRGFEPYSIRMPDQHAGSATIDGPALVRLCVLAGDRVGLERLAEAGFASPLSSNGLLPPSVVFAVLMGGDQAMIDHAMIHGALGSLDLYTHLAHPLGIAIASHAAPPGVSALAKRWGTPENLAHWFKAACRYHNTPAAAALLEAMDDATVAWIMPDGLDAYQGGEAVLDVIGTGDPDLLRQLVERAGPLSDLALRGTVGRAMQTGNAAMLECVLSLGAPADRVWNRLLDPHKGLTRAQLEAMLAVLVEHGVDLDHADGLAYPPLFLACRDGDLRLVRALLDAGADPNMPYEEYGVAHTLLSWIDDGRHRFREPIPAALIRQILIDYGAQ